MWLKSPPTTADAGFKNGQAGKFGRGLHSSQGLHIFYEKLQGKAAFVVLKVFKIDKNNTFKISLNLA